MNKIEVLTIQSDNSKGMAVCLKPKIPFVITESLAHNIRNLQDIIINNYLKNFWNDPFFIIWYLHTGKIPWKGIDFNFIYNSLKEHKEVKIESYLVNIFDLLFINYIGLGLPVINCSIITRPLSGISQDFFYLNQINFIKKVNPSLDTNYKKLNFDKFKKALNLPESIFAANTYYTYNKFNSLEMKKILNMVNYISIDKENQLKIKKIFDEIRNEALHRIDKLASQNIKLFERMAVKQAK